MNASFSIELGIEHPMIIASGIELRDLDPAQIRWVSIKLTAVGGQEVSFTAKSEEAPFMIRDLVTFAHNAQPEGTEVHVWYQGRSERLSI